jgi:hypothetical protein
MFYLYHIFPLRQHCDTSARPPKMWILFLTSLLRLKEQKQHKAFEKNVPQRERYTVACVTNLTYFDRT